MAKQVQKHVLFLTLASYDAAFSPVPRLATWSWSEDRTVLTLHLRRDVRWHDGAPTTADDVVWTLRAAMEPATAYPRARDLGQVRGVVGVDSFTVRIEFAGPQPQFPDVLTDLAILPSHLLGEADPGEVRTHPFNLRPVGNGPFEFVEYRPNQRWVFHRADGFPPDLGRPALERFVVVVVDEATTKLAALTSGELDLAGINPAHARFVRSDPALTVLDYPVQFAVALVWNLRRPPYDDAALRRALTMAIDRELLVEAHVYGFGAVADGPVSPSHPWYEAVEPVPFDPGEAEASLAALGWARGPDGMRQHDGRRLVLEVLAVSSGDNALEQMIQAQLRSIGVEARIRLLELSSFLAVAQGERRDFDALVIGVPGDLSLGHVAAMYESGDGPLAYPGYRNAAFDRAVAAGGAARTLAEREAAWREAQAILARDLPTTWLYHARGVQGANRRLGGLTLDLRGELATVSGWFVDRREADR